MQYIFIVMQMNENKQREAEMNFDLINGPYLILTLELDFEVF